ncbi:MAG: hypothetical protein ACLFM0_08225 [Spirochaetales bacterium]
MIRANVRTCVLLTAVLLTPALPAFAEEESDEAVELHYFWGDGCPVCDEQHLFLDDLQEEFDALTVSRHEVWDDEEGFERLRDTASRLGFEVRGVPVTVIGERHWTGFNEQIAAEIERTVKQRVERAEGASGDGISDGKVDVSNVRVPLFGEVSLRDAPLVLSTLLIAFVDGFNPCSIWVLTMLLALVVYTHSRVRTLLVGATFLVVTAAVYGGFITGVFGVFGAIAHRASVRAPAAIVALLFGLLSVRDYFAFGGRLSLTISDSNKVAIASRIASLVRGDRSIVAMVAMTAALALSVAVVELPCTAGFPVIWTGLVAGREVGPAAFAGLLGAYLVMYLLIELVIFAIAFFGLSTRRIREGYARVVKLFGGLVMVTLGWALVFAPEALYSFERSLALFGAAIAAGVAIRVVHRRIHA